MAQLLLAADPTFIPSARSGSMGVSSLSCRSSSSSSSSSSCFDHGQTSDHAATALTLVIMAQIFLGFAMPLWVAALNQLPTEALWRAPQLPSASQGVTPSCATSALGITLPHASSANRSSCWLTPHDKRCFAAARDALGKRGDGVLRVLRRHGIVEDSEVFAVLEAMQQLEEQRQAARSAAGARRAPAAAVAAAGLGQRAGQRPIDYDRVDPRAASVAGSFGGSGDAAAGTAWGANPDRSASAFGAQGEAGRWQGELGDGGVSDDWGPGWGRWQGSWLQVILLHLLLLWAAAALALTVAEVLVECDVILPARCE